MKVEFFVHGQPVPQGSMRAFVGNVKGAPGKKRAFMFSDNKKLNPWRQSVAMAAVGHFPKPAEGAVQMSLVFQMPKPKTVKRDEPTVKPDVDKLVRGVFDALRQIAYHDDAQVTLVAAQKVYGTPGAHIQVMWNEKEEAA